ncbi:putative ankyrin repeat-containing domain, PGG domain, ankyrin repeat-containing domain superfamily [Helianthus annuus]|nr:putative ankyrin repeat-containing domain, PGG domain, ankyrin repeat-containing domain superfamily [Helianthus annuus]
MLLYLRKVTSMLSFLVKKLVERMQTTDLELQNKSYNTALYLAAAAGNIKAIKIMVEKNKALLTIAGGNRKMMPLYVATLYGNEDVVQYMYNHSNNLRDGGWMPLNRGWLLLKCVENDMFDVALKIVTTYPDLGTGSVLEVLARKPEAFREMKLNVISRTIRWGKILYSKMLSTPQRSQIENPEVGRESGLEDSSLGLEPFPEKRTSMIDRIIKSESMEKKDNAMKLLRLIWGYIAKKPKKEIDNILRGPRDVQRTRLALLFVAAKFGNREFVVELIRLYPDLIWKVDDNNQSIFHVAVAHRHEGIYNLLYEIGSMKDLISPLRDRNDNNILHLVGRCAKQKRLEDVSGVALKVQRELLWLKEVEAMIPPAYRERKNKDGLTPYELFTKEHKDLVDQGEKWLKDIANHCMVIDCLITAMVFVAAYTFPGGYRQTEDKYNGFPVFLSKPSFLVFVLADGTSFLLSCASIAIFSSINTSRFAKRDFLQTLPNKLMFGLGTLVLSMMMLTIAFSVSFFCMLRQEGFLGDADYYRCGCWVGSPPIYKVALPSDL